MPCYDGREAEDNSRNYDASCILCAVIQKHGEKILEDLDYKQLGMTRTAVKEWLAYHRLQDSFK